MNRRSCILAVAALLVAASMASLAAAQTSEAPAPVGATDASGTSPGKAAALSIVPGLYQHQVGSHGKAVLMECAVVGGIVLMASSGSKSSDSYTPPEYTPPSHRSRPSVTRFATISSGDGNGDGNGDSGSSAGRIAGAGIIVGGVVWSMLDASSSARRFAQARSSQLGVRDKPASFGMMVVPSWTGVTAGVSLTF